MKNEVRVPNPTGKNSSLPYDEIERMRRDGMTYQQIGDHFGVTRERIRQLLNKIDSSLAHRRTRVLSDDEVAKVVEMAEGGCVITRIYEDTGIKPYMIERLCEERGVKISSVKDSHRITDQRYQSLIDLAKSGAEKPGIHHELYLFMMTRTRVTDPRYNRSFHHELNQIRPDWFVKSKNKDILREMADAGEDKPASTSKLGISFYGYVNPSSKMYDAAFRAHIANTRPDWLVDRRRRVAV